jgi:hypothetical protein
VGDERDRNKQNETPDVEAHKFKLQPDDEEKGEEKDDDTPDVEAHRMR